MGKRIRIGILGIGAVGGYFGGQLAEAYHNSDKAEIIFITLPKAEEIIREKGLKLITPQGERIIHPDVVVSNTDNIGTLDYLILAIKSYDLENSLLNCKKCISENTIILPLLNGVDAKERILKLFPVNIVLEGCVYIVARLIEPGVVKETGNIHTLYFGSATASKGILLQLEELFAGAGIDVHLEPDIQQSTWEKFIFISSLASLSSHYDCTVGELLEQHRDELITTLEEIKAVADAAGINIPGNIIETTIAKFERLPYETISSMHSDFRREGKTEYRSLTEYVTVMGDRLNVHTPVYDTILADLEQRVSH